MKRCAFSESIYEFILGPGDSISKRRVDRKHATLRVEYSTDQYGLLSKLSSSVCSIIARHEGMFAP